MAGMRKRIPSRDASRVRRDGSGALFDAELDGRGGRPKIPFTSENYLVIPLQILRLFSGRGTELPSPKIFQNIPLATTFPPNFSKSFLKLRYVRRIVSENSSRELSRTDWKIGWRSWQSRFTPLVFFFFWFGKTRRPGARAVEYATITPFSSILSCCILKKKEESGMSNTSIYGVSRLTSRREGEFCKVANHNNKMYALLWSAEREKLRQRSKGREE